MSLRPSRLVPLLLAVLVAAPVVGATAAVKIPDPADDELTGRARLEALVERIKLEQKNMKSLTARFTQRRESDLLMEPEVAEGIFYYQAPDRVRWEYRTPNPISVLIDGQEMTTWYRDLGRADRLQIGRYSSQVFKYLGASGSMETLVDYFRVLASFPDEAGEPYRLRLLPKYDRISDKLESMTLWIDPERYFPRRLRYVSSDGDVTEYEFHDLEVNGDVPGERFSLDLPSDVEIRTMDVGQGAG